MSDGRVVICGLGQLSAVGQGMAHWHAGLQTKVVPARTPRSVMMHNQKCTLDILAVPEFTLSSVLPEAVQRRMPKIAKMFYAVALEALDDAFASDSPLSTRPERVGMVIGTAFAGLDLSNQFEKRLVLEGPAGASPNLFATSVQNAIASSLSLSLGIQGPTTTVNVMDHTTMASLGAARDWIVQGKVDHVLVLIGDEVSEMHIYAKSDKLAHVPPCDLILGEGVAGFVLSAAPRAVKSYAELSRVDLFEHDWPTDIRRLNADHEYLYGNSVTGAAFEVLTGCLLTQQNSRSTLCLQTTNGGETVAVQLDPLS